jgi:hypothetical protein
MHAQILERGLAGSEVDTADASGLLHEVLEWVRKEQGSSAADAAAELWEWRLCTPAYKVPFMMLQMMRSPHVHQPWRLDRSSI